MSLPAADISFKSTLHFNMIYPVDLLFLFTRSLHINDPLSPAL
jgi:hypothetical protein